MKHLAPIMTAALLLGACASVDPVKQRNALNAVNADLAQTLTDAAGGTWPEYTEALSRQSDAVQGIAAPCDRAKGLSANDLIVKCKAVSVEAYTLLVDLPDAPEGIDAKRMDAMGDITQRCPGLADRADCELATLVNATAGLRRASSALRSTASGTEDVSVDRVVEQLNTAREEIAMPWATNLVSSDEGATDPLGVYSSRLAMVQTLTCNTLNGALILMRDKDRVDEAGANRIAGKHDEFLTSAAPVLAGPMCQAEIGGSACDAVAASCSRSGDGSNCTNSQKGVVSQACQPNIGGPTS